MRTWQIKVGGVVYVHCYMSNWGESFVAFTGIRGDGQPLHIRTTLPYIAFEETGELEAEAQRIMTAKIFGKRELQESISQADVEAKAMENLAKEEPLR